MCKKIKREGVDIDKLVIEDTIKAVDYLHTQYDLAVKQLQINKALESYN